MRRCFADRPGIVTLAVGALLSLLVATPGFSETASDLAASRAEEPGRIGRVVFAFKGDGDSGRWMIVNDGVMGGLSSSRMVLTENDTAVFEGDVSLENNGGFASVLSRPAPMPTAGTSRLVVRLRGDGRDYQLRIRTSDGFDGIAYRWDFTTRADEWVTLEAPYGDFVPTFRGLVLRDVPPIDPAVIRQLGFLIADKVEGPFRLEVDWIMAQE
jgi:monofunctional biosynthetic peptidoglycan transglycosylase